MKKCKEGYKGMCCCNCKHQMKLMCHPGNSDFGRGSIMKQCGYICKVSFPEDGIFDQTIFMDRRHGMCEMHDAK